MKNIVTQQWLNTHSSRSHLVICDCRFDLKHPEVGRALYEKDHIKGAVYVDLERDLSAMEAPYGGRHPLPALPEIAATAGRLGIDETKTVVAYDDQNGAMAARLWWMLKQLGHEQVYVLQENYSAWKEKGYPVDGEPVSLPAVQYTPSPSRMMTADVHDVKRSIREGKPQHVLIDSREEKRFSGEVEPIDKKAGHIPGAFNVPWMENIEGTMGWKSSAELAALHRVLQHKEEVIVYCGSGVTACANILGMDEAGISNVKLYPGSWSEWITTEEHPVEKGRGRESL